MGLAYSEFDMEPLRTIMQINSLTLFKDHVFRCAITDHQIRFERSAKSGIFDPFVRDHQRSNAIRILAKLQKSLTGESPTRHSIRRPDKMLRNYPRSFVGLRLCR